MTDLTDATTPTAVAQPPEAPSRTDTTQVVANGPAFLAGRPIGEILRATMGLSEEKLQEALAAQAEKGGRLGEVLVGIKAVSEEDEKEELAAEHIPAEAGRHQSVEPVVPLS